MRRRLTDLEIEGACRALLTSRRRVSVRDVAGHLRATYGAVGRRARVAAALLKIEGECPPPGLPTVTEQGSTLEDDLRAARERLARAEERETKHQDLWAARYAERVAELEQRHQMQLALVAKHSSERYLRVYQWGAQLAERLARYEVVEPFEAKSGTLITR
jgi:hypothetical protein